MAAVVALAAGFNAVADWYNYTSFLAYDPRPCMIRFAPLLAYLPNWVKVSYVTDEDLEPQKGMFVLKSKPACFLEIKSKAEFVAIQYSIVPHLLVHRFDNEWIVGNFGNTNVDRIKVPNWQIVKDFGNGMVLWKRSS